VAQRPTIPREFGTNQVARIGGLVEFARELTGEYFSLGLDEARRIPYEIRTLCNLALGEIHDNEVLADIARYQYEEPRFGRKCDWYRVNLQDHNILEVLRRKPGQFAPLLLYILTHEIIHVIRFVKFLAPFHLDSVEREREEQRVHSVTHRILSRVPLRGMSQVLCQYEQFKEDEQGT
jgi:hypothetical protein